MKKIRIKIGSEKGVKNGVKNGQKTTIKKKALIKCWKDKNFDKERD